MGYDQAHEEVSPTLPQWEKGLAAFHFHHEPSWTR